MKKFTITFIIICTILISGFANNNEEYQEKEEVEQVESSGGYLFEIEIIEGHEFYAHHLGYSSNLLVHRPECEACQENLEETLRMIMEENTK
jgi:hypothetical protein